MRRTVKVLLAIALLLLVLVALGLAWLFVRYPRVGPAPAVQVAGTPEQLARGEYLANHVTVCMDCHSRRDWSRYSGPPVPGTLGHGGEAFTRAMGFPGDLYVPNVTPAALGEWTDGEVLRAFTSGVARDGRALFPLMPYGVYRHLSRRDAEAILAYLRTLPRGGGAVPERSLDFPLDLIVRTMPQEASLRTDTPVAGTPAHGEYMATVAGCVECHTPVDRGTPLPGMTAAGGRPFEIPSGAVMSANLTPDPLTGIGGWSKADFLARFRAFAGGAPAVAPEDDNTVMPWTMYAGMTDADLGAIYDFLRTLPPVRNAVERWPDTAPPAR
jgi:mono/diheme cytochrome c family protein